MLWTCRTYLRGAKGGTTGRSMESGVPNRNIANFQKVGLFLYMVCVLILITLLQPTTREDVGGGRVPCFTHAQRSVSRAGAGRPRPSRSVRRGLAWSLVGHNSQVRVHPLTQYQCVCVARCCVSASEIPHG